MIKSIFLLILFVPVFALSQGESLSMDSLRLLFNQKIRYDNSKNLLEPVEYNSKFGMINRKIQKSDTTYSLVIPFEYDWLRNESMGLIAAKMDDKWGYINRQNSVKIPFDFNYASTFYEGFGLVRKDNGYYYIDKKGNNKFDRTFYDAEPFFFNHALVFDEKGQSGLINKKGDFVIALQDKEIWNSDFYDGYEIKSNDKIIALLNQKGETIKTDSLTEIEDYYFSKRKYLFLTSHNGLYGLLNFDGSTIIPPKYEKFECDYGECWIFSSKTECSFFNYNLNKFIIEFGEYEMISPMEKSDDDYFIVMKNNKYGLVDKKGSLILDIKYDKGMSMNDDYSFYRDPAFNVILDGKSCIVHRYDIPVKLDEDE